ncbi:MAG: isocitrate lyase/phosphoenolpyruvate mutase family protein [Acidobacteriota bacterium]|nr:isocitrate lyase/phosphoenolpyruvate mutase family protein [Acidobacteriota bacterium]
MNRTEQIARAETFRALHRGSKLLVLPNVWDPLGAQLLESLGYPAVATASAAVAFSHGIDDGERIGFDTMLDVIRRIVKSVEVPVSADIETGFAEEPGDVAGNMRRLLETGAVGINLEDSRVELPRRLYPLELQRARIQAVREMANDFGVPLVINARIDVFVRPVPESRSEKIAEAVHRGNAYVEAGADCVFPVALGDFEILKTLQREIDAPINASATASTPSIAELEQSGIARLSLGPGLLKAALTAMREVASGLQDPRGSYTGFTRDAMTSAEIEELVSK